MKISVITPVYNAEKTIEKTILSVIREKEGHDLEYIVIDGKSTDNTMNVLQKYSNNIDFISSERDEGIYDAFNKGIKKAAGEFIFFLAADDELLVNAINSFLQSVREDTEIWCGSMISYNDTYYRYYHSKYDLSKLYNGCSLCHPASFLRKEIYYKYGFYNNSFKIAADRELFLRMYNNNVIFQIEEIPIVLFSNNGVSNNVRNYKQMLEENVSISILYGKTEDEARRVFERRYGPNPPKQKKSIVRDLLFQVLGTEKTIDFLKSFGKGQMFLGKKELIRYGLYRS